VFMFMGRLTADKGVLELAEAFRGLASSVPDAYLLIVGPDEEQILTDRRFEALPRWIAVGQTQEPERYLQAADVLCLPSKRESFGMVIIEAAAVGIPAIASDIYGITDSVVRDETGILVRPQDPTELGTAMFALATSPERRSQLGEQARRWVSERFPQERVTDAVVAFYERALGGRSAA
jgi:glycosyltransferase involved in cell wall biosynthesis